MARIFGLVFSGFMVRLYGCAIALYVGLTVAHLVTDTFGQVSNALAVLK